MKLDRRDFLKLAGPAAAAPALGAGAAFAQQNGTAPAASAAPFDPASILAEARQIAARPFAPLPPDLPSPFSGLNYEAYSSIRLKPEAALWVGDNLPFVIEPMHRGFIFARQMQIFIVENGTARPLGYDPAAFDFGKVPAPQGRLPDLGFSGFRILRRRPEGPPADLAIFQGASFFRSLAPGQNFGVIARALAIRTADPKGEEFPVLRSVWIEKPTGFGNPLVIHALLDSESVAGAYRFTIRPGEATIIDIEATIVPRVALDHVGLAPMQGTSLFGPLDRRRFDDARPAAYEVSGLQMLTGKNEWLWRPVSNRENLQISAFVDNDPKRFGFVQRERDFERFFDDDQHWETRPSLWIEPIGEWGEGAVQLVEIPSDAEANDNVIAYWRPKAPLAASAEHSFAYRQFWCWTPPDQPPLAMVTNSRTGRIGNTKRRRFVVEFSGEVFAAARGDLRANLTVQPGTILSLRTFWSRERRSMRVLFDIEPGDAQCELRMLITEDGRPISETWLYRWTS